MKIKNLNMNIRVIQQEIVLNHGKNLTIAKIAVDEIIKRSTTEKYAKEIAAKYATEHGYKEDDLIVYLVYTEKNNI